MAGNGDQWLPTDYDEKLKGTQFTYDIPDGLIPGDCVEIKGVLTGHRVVLELASQQRSSRPAQLPLRVSVNRGGHFEILSQPDGGNNDRVKTGKCRGEFRTSSSFTVQILVETEYYEIRLNDETLAKIEHDNLHQSIQMLMLDGEAEFTSVEFLDIEDMDESLDTEQTDGTINPALNEPLDVEVEQDAVAQTARVDLPSVGKQVMFPQPDVDISIDVPGDAELSAELSKHRQDLEPLQHGEHQLDGEVSGQVELNISESGQQNLDAELSGQAMVETEASEQLDIEISEQAEQDIEVSEHLDVEDSEQAEQDADVSEHLETEDYEQTEQGVVISDQENLMERNSRNSSSDSEDGASSVSLSGELNANAKHADANLDLTLEVSANVVSPTLDSVDAGLELTAEPSGSEGLDDEAVEDQMVMQQATVALHSQPPLPAGVEEDKEEEEEEMLEVQRGSVQASGLSRDESKDDRPDDGESKQTQPPPEPRTPLRHSRETEALTKKQLKQHQKQLKEQRKQQRKLEKQQEKQEKEQRRQQQKEQKRSGKKSSKGGSSLWNLFRRSKSYSLERASRATATSDGAAAASSGTYRPASWLSEDSSRTTTAVSTPTPTPKPTPKPTPMVARFHSVPRLLPPAPPATPSPQSQRRRDCGEFILARPPDEMDQLETESVASDHRMREPELSSFRRSVQENLLAQQLRATEPHTQSSFFRARNSSSSSSSTSASGGSSGGSLAGSVEDEALVAGGRGPRDGSAGRRLVTLR